MCPYIGSDWMGTIKAPPTTQRLPAMKTSPFALGCTEPPRLTKKGTPRKGGYKPTTMFYVVSKRFADAMRYGSKVPKGAIYGIYATEEAANQACKKKIAYLQQKDGSSIRMPTAEVVEQ